MPYIQRDDHGAIAGLPREAPCAELIVENVINITDLPEQAQAKLFARKSFRERITRHSLRLFDDSGAADVIGDTQFGGLR